MTNGELGWNWVLPGDGLDQPERPLDGVDGVPYLPQMSKDGLDGRPDPVQLGGRQQVVDGKVLHQRVVGVDRVDGLLQTRVRVKRHRRVEPIM